MIFMVGRNPKPALASMRASGQGETLSVSGQTAQDAQGIATHTTLFVRIDALTGKG